MEGSLKFFKGLKFFYVQGFRHRTQTFTAVPVFKINKLLSHFNCSTTKFFVNLILNSSFSATYHMFTSLECLKFESLTLWFSTVYCIVFRDSRYEELDKDTVSWSSFWYLLFWVWPGYLSVYLSCIPSMTCISAVKLYSYKIPFGIEYLDYCWSALCVTISNLDSDIAN